MGTHVLAGLRVLVTSYNDATDYVGTKTILYNLGGVPPRYSIYSTLPNKNASKSLDFALIDRDRKRKKYHSSIIMRNYQDWLSILGGADGDGGCFNCPRSSTAGGTTKTSNLLFKADKMNTILKSNGKYRVEPDVKLAIWTRRAESFPRRMLPEEHAKG